MILPIQIMSAETPSLPQYIATLPHEVTQVIAAQRDDRLINRFFYHLLHDSPIADDDRVLQEMMQNTAVSSAIDEYINQMVELGLVEKYRKYLKSRSGSIDPQDLEEIVYFSIWRSFLVYPWENGYNQSSLDTYIYLSLRQFAREVMKRKHVSYHPELGSSGLSAAEMQSNGFTQRQPINPEAHFLEQEAVTNLAEKIAHQTTRNTDLKELKINVMHLLAEGYTTKEVADILHIPYRRVKRWLRASKKLPVDDQNIRVQTDARGNWRWTPQTSQVLLANKHIRALLTPREICFLERIREGERHIDIISDPQFHVNTNQIRHKVISHGTQTDLGQESRRPGRHQLLFYVRSLRNLSEEDRMIVDAIEAEHGNVLSAARRMNRPRNYIVGFLKRVAYYAK